MGVVANEPSMEDILSSIKRIIADGSDRPSTPRAPRRKGPAPEQLDGTDEADIDLDIDGRDDAADEQESAILELTDMVEEAASAPEPVAAAPEAPVTTARKGAAKAASLQPTVKVEEQILSDVSAQAARQSLSQLSSLLVRPQEGESNTLEGLVREMMRPMLKEWLEAKLPELVESMVKKEIDRIVGRLG